jgi:alanine dehydrogenase
MAMGLGSEVTVIDNDLNRLRLLGLHFGPRLTTIFSTSHSIHEVVTKADLVVGSVLIPGKRAPKLITREVIKQMTPGSVFVDIAIDQGGCSETSKTTSHSNPTYVVDGVIHYCVDNMPGACALTATQSLTNATLHYALKIANKGLMALNEDHGLRNGLNVYRGLITNEHVAHDLGYEYVPPYTVLEDSISLS